MALHRRGSTESLTSTNSASSYLTCDSNFSSSNKAGLGSRSSTMASSGRVGIPSTIPAMQGSSGHPAMNRPHSSNDEGMSRNRQVNLIRKMQRLRDLQDSIGSDETPIHFNFPQIVAIGSQSSGKSSVLESIVGVEFLPRDKDMCTRCPLVLNLRNDPSRVRGEFTFAGDETIYTDPARVTQRINEITDSIAQEYKSVSFEAISLTYTACDVVDLQLVDLPGFIMNVVDGQNERVREDINRLAQNFIAEENVLILAVQSATSDHIQNSVALMMAKKMDPEKKRTIGVLTKMDLLPHDKDHIEPICRLIKNEEMPLQRGYFPVINRSAEEFNNNTPIQQVREKEREKLQSLLRHNYNDKCGIENLGSYLFTEFAKAIDLRVPDVIQQARATLEDIEFQLHSVGFEDDDTKKTEIVMSLVHKYCEMVITALEGNNIDANDDKLDVGYNFLNKLKMSVSNACMEATDFDQPAILRRMEIAMGNINASYDAFILNERIFHKFVHDLTDRFSIPLTKVIDEMTAFLVNGINSKIKEILSDRPLLEHAISTVVFKRIEEIRKTCRGDMVKHIGIHKNLVNIQHPDFTEVKDQLDGKSVLDRPEAEQASSSTGTTVPTSNGGSISIPTQKNDQPNFALQMILKYMNIVDKILKDYALKSIHYHLMREVIDFHSFHNLWGQMGNPDLNQNQKLAAADEQTQRHIDILRSRRQHINQVLETLES